MALSPIEIELLAISKYKKSQIDWLQNGVRIEQMARQSISALVMEACTARHALAGHFLKSAAMLLNVRPARHRDSVSRSYYAMYHAARALVYYMHKGDDHQEHDQLHKFFPSDFPSVDFWQNELKAARLKRNEADYEFLPKGHAPFRKASRTLYDRAQQFHSISARYLRAQGCIL